MFFEFVQRIEGYKGGAANSGWPPKDVWHGAGICQKPLEKGVGYL